MRALLPLIGVSLLVSGTAEFDWLGLPVASGATQSLETRLPDTWAPSGENLVWQAPYGSTSGPVVLGDRVYLQNTVGDGATLQERIVCLDANTGRLVWQRFMNVNHSDTSPSRVGLAAPALDPGTGDVYVFTAGGNLLAFTRTGLPLWGRDLTEELGYMAPEGGQVASPIVDGSLVIVSGITIGWGESGGAVQRFLAFDKSTGDSVWFSAPEKRPYAPSASPLFAVDMDDIHLLVAPGADGAWHGLVASTGRPIWRYQAAKRALDLGAVRMAEELILVHGDSASQADAGGVVALGPGIRGDVAPRQLKWSHSLRGPAIPASGPVTDGRRVYLMDETGAIAAFDPGGKPAWSQEVPKLAIRHGAAPAVADGKLFVGTSDGRFVIFRLRPDAAEVLSDVRLPNGSDAVAQRIAISQGRIYLATAKAVYAIGDVASRLPVWSAPPPTAVRESNRRMPPGDGRSTGGRDVPLEPVPQVLQVVPAAATLIPGQAVNFRVRLIDASGRLIREEGAQPPRQTSIPGQGALQSKQPSPARDLQWSLDALVGVVQADGRYVVPGDARAQAGRVMVRRGPLIGESRIRVVPPHWQVTFEGSPPGAVPSWWVGAHDRFTVKAVDGVNVLASLPGGLSAPAQVARGFSGPHRATNYTMEADIRLTGGSALGEGAVLAQGYELAVAGSRQQLELRSWTPEAGRTKTAAMPLTAGTWVRVKLRVELMLDGGVLAQGKAWPKDAPEPAAWSVERRDPPGFGLLIGSPGIASSGPSEVHFNNLRVFPN